MAHLTRYYNREKDQYDTTGGEVRSPIAMRTFDEIIQRDSHLRFSLQRPIYVKTGSYMKGEQRITEVINIYNSSKRDIFGTKGISLSSVYQSTTGFLLPFSRKGFLSDAVVLTNNKKVLKTSKPWTLPVTVGTSFTMFLSLGIRDIPEDGKFHTVLKHSDGDDTNVDIFIKVKRVGNKSTVSTKCLNTSHQFETNEDLLVLAFAVDENFVDLYSYGELVLRSTEVILPVEEPKPCTTEIFGPSQFSEMFVLTKKHDMEDIKEISDWIVEAL